MAAGSKTRELAMLACPGVWVTIALSVGWPSAWVSPSIVNRSFGANGSASQPVAR